MIVRLRKGLLVVTPEAEAAGELAAWLETHAGQVFRLRGIAGGSAVFTAIGPEPEACRIPLNITSKVAAPLNLISNFSRSPFTLDGKDYASVEGFWQGLKFPDEADRRRLAGLFGAKPKDEGFGAPAADTLVYEGQTIRVGTWDHWQLMERACAAKFEQNGAARRALLSTGTRPLEHRMRRDSRTIPGAIMAEIWMRLRDRLAKMAASEA